MNEMNEKYIPIRVARPILCDDQGRTIVNKEEWRAFAVLVKTISDLYGDKDEFAYYMHDVIFGYNERHHVIWVHNDRDMLYFHIHVDSLEVYATAEDNDSREHTISHLTGSSPATWEQLVAKTNEIAN